MLQTGASLLLIPRHVDGDVLHRGGRRPGRAGGGAALPGRQHHRPGDDDLLRGARLPSLQGPSSSQQKFCIHSKWQNCK